MYMFIKTELGQDIVVSATGFKKEELTVTTNGKSIIVEGSTSNQYSFEPIIYHEFIADGRIERVEPELSNGVLVIHVYFAQKKYRTCIIK